MEPGKGVETYCVEPSPVDITLLEVLGPRRYDELNQVVHAGIVKTYKREMMDACAELLENDRIIGRILPPEGNTNNEIPVKETDWFEDPTEMSTVELSKAISKLQLRIKTQKNINERESSDIELLTLARNQLDMDLGWKFFELQAEEEQMLDKLT